MIPHADGSGASLREALEPTRWMLASDRDAAHSEVIRLRRELTAAEALYRHLAQEADKAGIGG